MAQKGRHANRSMSAKADYTFSGLRVPASVSGDTSLLFSYPD